MKGKGGVKKVNPIKLTAILKRLVREVKYARVLGDRNLLIGCKMEVQVEKAKKITYVGNIKVARVVRVGEQRFNGSKGVISGIPLSVKMGELLENLKEKNSSVKNAKRMTRGIEKKETENKLIV